MQTTLNIPGLLAPYAGGNETLQVEGGTVLECLQEAKERYPGLGAALFDKSGAVDSLWLVLLNKTVVSPHGLEREVAPGDVVRIIPIAAGG